MFDIIRSAGWPIWPLLFASVIAVALIIERLIALRRSVILPKGLLERVLAEYQRREETRKERYENRLRALEGTVAALQQQIVQMVQVQRQPKRRGWW